MPEPSEQAVIARMANLRTQGLSLWRIANQLNNDQVPTKQGDTWRAQTVKNILEAAPPLH